MGAPWKVPWDNVVESWPLIQFGYDAIQSRYHMTTVDRVRAHECTSDMTGAVKPGAIRVLLRTPDHLGIPMPRANLPMAVNQGSIRHFYPPESAVTFTGTKAFRTTSSKALIPEFSFSARQVI